MWAYLWAVVAWACLGDCSAKSLDGILHNFATTSRYTQDWTLTSPKNMRKEHLHRIWKASSAGHPFLPSSAAHLHPPDPSQLRDNGLLLGDEDYDEVPSSVWLGQSTVHPFRHGSTSLEGLQHLLEGEVLPKVKQVGLQGGTSREQEGTSGVPLSESHLSQHQFYGEDDMFPRGGGAGGEQTTDLASSQVQPPTLGRYNYPHTSLGWPGTLSKEILKDILDQLAVEPLSRQDQFSNDFLSRSQHLEGEDLGQLPPNIHADGQYSKSLPKEFFLSNLLGEVQLNNGNSQKDIMNRFGAPDYPDHAALPDMLANHQGLEEFIHQHGYASTSQKEDLPGLSHQGDQGKGSGWLPSTLSRLKLPASKDLAKTCHARHLHTCGGRVIENFSHEPDYADTCRIREEFLDCMENEQKEPCRPQGEHFTQKGTRRIIDRIKKLLWSARGCILSHSP